MTNITTTYGSQIRQLGDCRCGESTRTTGSVATFGHAYRPDFSADKCWPMAKTSLYGRTTTGGHPLCPPFMTVPQLASYSRYSMTEWQQTNFDNLNNADKTRGAAEQVKAESLRTVRDTHSRTKEGQRESTQKLGERIGDVNYWRNEVLHELEQNATETGKLEDTKRKIECALRELQNMIKVVTSCLYAREARQGIDHVHDAPEVGLNRELEIIRSVQERLCRLLEQVERQLLELRDARHCLERDSLDKFSALNIDKYAHGLKDSSPGRALYPGIENWDNTLSTPETWMEYTIRLIQRSKNARAISQRLRAEADALVNTVIKDMWSAWGSTNHAITTRVQETTEAKNRIQLQLARLMKEIADLEKFKAILERALADKCAPLKTAHTRLERRTHRPCMELTKDAPMGRLQAEVYQIYDSVDQLKAKLQETEDTIARLLRQKNKMEEELQIKANTLRIDRDGVLGSRRSFPVTSIISKCL